VSGYREIEEVRIPMEDGVSLSARLWLPDGADRTPVPAILEYLPYRKRDMIRRRDETTHRYLASRGYAGVRVDVRGSGDSDGILTDEYAEAELDDALAVIAWLAAQPWCSGAVGMMGLSWGGFNALMVAARRPPALKAVIAIGASDDRFGDDAHYMGGCLLNENFVWGSALFMYGAYPPDPALVGPRWRAMWDERLAALERTTPFPALWLGHQRYDAYWKRGSIAEDYGAIACPVYAVSGWADAYTNFVLRLLANLKVPCKGLVGPWPHAFPNAAAAPGPAVDFLGEAVRWWDHWLKGIDTGIMQEPRLRAWMQESVAPAATHPLRPGRWVAENAWPSPRIRTWSLAFGAGTLGDDANDDASSPLMVASPVTTGADGGEWCAFGSDGEHPGDQRADDGRSLVFDSEPLVDRCEILGTPLVTLAFSVDRPLAMIAVRLNDAAPDGASTRVTYGLLNLAHRTSREAPAPLVPGRRTVATVRLNDIAHAFPAGHRIRLAISTVYWPIAWPSPAPATLAVDANASALHLPLRPPAPDDAALAPLPPPPPGLADAPVELVPSVAVHKLVRTVARGEHVHVTARQAADPAALPRVRLPAIDLEIGQRFERRYTIVEGDPLSARTDFSAAVELARPGWSVAIEGATKAWATATTFEFVADLRARLDGTLVFEHTWQVAIPRDHV